MRLRSTFNKATYITHVRLQDLLCAREIWTNRCFGMRLNHTPKVVFQRSYVARGYIVVTVDEMPDWG